MIAKAGGYYGSDFQGFRGLTQGEPVYPTIFNVEVDAVVRHWVNVMVESADKQSGRGQERWHQNDLFYADDGMVASSDLRWLQGSFSTLVGMFDRVGLKTNVSNTVGMVCRLFQAAVNQSKAVYGRQMMEAGPSYR